MTHTDAIRFGLWAARLGRLPSHTEILAVFPVDRATAYRWRNALADAWGVDSRKTACFPQQAAA